MNCSVVIPAKNEATSLSLMLPGLIRKYPDFEIVVVNDGSTDNTDQICNELGVICVTHPYNKGNGAAIKTGARIATGDVIVFMDADGQHQFDDIERLLEKLDEGYDMVVGARDANTQASIHRRLANNIYNKLASLMTGFDIKDLTSGFRAVRRKHFLKFLYLLPNGFSYPTTSTMAFFRSGLSVAYVPIKAKQRDGNSHIRLFKDGARFFVIILKIGALFSPMRFFLPISAGLFSIGLAYYAYTYFNFNRFTNMSALLFMSSLLTFLMGILSEQVSSLHYRSLEREQWSRSRIEQEDK